MQWLKKHFEDYRQLTPWGFCWRIAIEGVVVALVATIVMAMLGLPGREIPMGFAKLLFLGVLVAPILETLILQAFPVCSLARR